MNELKITTDIQLGVINFDNTEIKEQLAEQMKLYTEMEITEEGKKTAKEDLATLRKIKDAVEKKRKEVKSAFNKPYEDFEASVKELTALIDEPIKYIDEKVKAFDEKSKQEKQVLVNSLFYEAVGELKDLVTLESVFNPKWLNASYKEKDIKYDLNEKFTGIKSGLNIIKGFHSECEAKAIQLFVSSGYNTEKTVESIQAYENQKAEILKSQEEHKAAEEKRLAEEEARKQEEAARKAEEEKNALKDVPVTDSDGFIPPVTDDTPFVQHAEDGPLTYSIKLQITGTEEQIQSLKQYLAFSEIDWEEI